MNLKILVFPFFSLLTLILIIGFMKPDFDLILEKKNMLTAQNTALASADAVVNQVATLSSDLENNQSSEKMLFDFLPSTLNQDNLIDSFNFLAGEGGLSVSTVVIEKPTNDASADTGLDATGTPSVVSSKASSKVFRFKGEVVGSYDSIKTFLDRLTHINRFKNVKIIALEQNVKKTSGQSEVKTADILKCSLTIDYGYLKDKSAESALDISFIKNQVSFDFSVIDRLKSQMTNTPSLVRVEAGKPNPFQ